MLPACLTTLLSLLCLQPSESAVEKLIQGLQGPVATDRSAAATKLGSLESGVASAVPALLEAYRKEREGSVSTALEEALVKIGKPVIPAAVRLARDRGRDSLERAKALRLLKQLSTLDASVAKVIDEMIMDQDPDVSYFAAVFAIQLNRENALAIKVLLHALQHAERYLDRSTAARHLAQTSARKATVPFYRNELEEAYRELVKGRDPKWARGFIERVLPFWEIGPEAREMVPTLEKYRKELLAKDELLGEYFSIFLYGAIVRIDPSEKPARAFLEKQVRTLVSILERADHLSVGYHPVFLVGTLGDLGKAATSAKPLLNELAEKDPNPDVRKAANDALKRIP